MAKKLIGMLAIALVAVGTTAHAGVAPASLCKDAKGKATGTKALGVLTAFGKNAKTPNVGKLSSDISKAQSKFSKAFTKAEFNGSGASKGCDVIEDSDDIEAKVDALVADVLDELAPPPVGPIELMGALTTTNGRFNYNLTLGLPGANAACNTNFPGTHACTYPELLIAEGAGDLDGLTDTAAITVTSFWAIDSSHNVQLQCIDDVPVVGSFLNWEYATAHTGTGGERVTLNNGTGVLGPLANALCLGSSWVGCCL